jgi:hypothetical protein
MNAIDVISSYEKFRFDIRLDVEKTLGVTLLNTIYQEPIRYDEFVNANFSIRIPDGVAWKCKDGGTITGNIWMTPLEIKYKIHNNKFHTPGNGCMEAGIGQYVWPEVFVKVVFFEDKYIILEIRGDELLNRSWGNPILQEDGRHSFINSDNLIPQENF